MPLLSRVQIEEMRNAPTKICANCHQTLRKNYCRECDVFFYVGHDTDCLELQNNDTYGDNHLAHRIYRVCPKCDQTIIENICTTHGDSAVFIEDGHLFNCPDFNHEHSKCEKLVLNVY